MKAVFVGIGAMVLCCLLYACSERGGVTPPPEQPEESSFDVTSNGDGRLLTTVVVRDKVTSCEYLVVKTGSGIAITPRIDGGMQVCR